MLHAIINSVISLMIWCYGCHSNRSLSQSLRCKGGIITTMVKRWWHKIIYHLWWSALPLSVSITTGICWWSVFAAAKMACKAHSINARYLDAHGGIIGLTVKGCFFLGSLLWWPELCKANTTSGRQACNSLYILYKIIYACKHYINSGQSTKMHRKSLMYRTWKICIFLRKTRQGLSDPPIKSWHHQLSTGVLMELYLIVVCLLEFLHNCPQLPSKMGQTGFLLVVRTTLP